MVHSSDRSFAGKLVLITGGSRGLGLAIAKEFVREKARVALIARDRHELEAAKNLLQKEQPGAIVYKYLADITKSDQMDNVLKTLTRDCGPVSVLVNNAGAILVSPYDSLVEEDFRAQMELHVFAVIRLTRWVVDQFRANKIKGRIVNICSLGGKIAVPHMLTYDTSKFALAGYSQGLAAELSPEGITITTIYPTVMRTGSPIQAVFKGSHEEEFAWFSTTDSMPGLSLAAQTAARRIVKASQARRSELVPSMAAKIRLLAGVIFPESMAWTMTIIARLLPKVQSKDYKTGAQSQGIFQRSEFYKIFERRIEKAQTELNQHEKFDPKFNLGIKP